MGTLYVVATPIGNLEDLSARAARVLREADRVYAEDTRRTRVLLEHLGAATPMTSLHGHNEASRLDEALARLAEGGTLALVSDAGTPAVSDPGERLVAAAAAAGHAVIPVPGPSAVLAALAASGLPAVPFTFRGFVPRRGRARTACLEACASAEETTVLFESPERLTDLLAALEAACGSDRRVTVARELTKVHEEFVRGTLAEVRSYYEEHHPKGEVTLVLAPAEGLPEDEVDAGAAEALAGALLAEGLSPSRAAREVSRR
ncbi:MAG: 16S rRNA (cytidine(1402)-2'-O)-methyltransferase, partial [Gemmatimonadetes bacterium]